MINSGFCITEKRLDLPVGALQGLLLLSQRPALVPLLPHLLCQYSVTLSHCHSAARRRERIWSCADRMQAVDGEDNRGVEKPCHPSAKNAWDDKATPTNTKKHLPKKRDTRRSRVSWKLGELKGSRKLEDIVPLLKFPFSSLLFFPVALDWLLTDNVIRLLVFWFHSRKCKVISVLLISHLAHFISLQV